MQTLQKIISTIFIVVIMISCGVNKNKSSEQFIKNDEIAFIEYIQTKESELVSGTLPRGRRIDGPTYHFDQEAKQLKILRKETFSLDTVKAFLGNVRILKGGSGSGLSMRLSAIGRFPFSMNDLKLLNIDRNGVKLVYDKNEILLQEGKEWKLSKSSLDTINVNEPTIVRTTTTYSIIYHGKIPKKGIIE
jgi:hypothetical protein